MTWIDNNGDIRPQSWEEYCTMVQNAPDWPTTQRLMERYGRKRRYRERYPRSQPPIRQRLFITSPYCFWCGVLTVLAGSNYNEPDLATVDHLYSKFHPERKAKHSSRGGNVLHVLACRACNQERALCELRQEIFIPKLTDKIEFAQRADATCAKKKTVTFTTTARPEVASGLEVNVSPADGIRVLTLQQEYEREVLRLRRKRKPIQTIKEAAEFARENPAR